jgi:hypothetical protein
LIFSFNFLIFLAVCLNISTVINIKILTNSNQQTQSYKFTSHIAAFLSGFYHRDAWNLHTNIIWSKRSTDFKELSPCSVWYPLKRNYLQFKCAAKKNQSCVLFIISAVEASETSLKEVTLMMIVAAKFSFKWPSCFKGEDFF